MVKCKCGALNPDDAKYCQKCGASLNKQIKSTENKETNPALTTILVLVVLVILSYVAFTVFQGIL